MANDSRGSVSSAGVDWLTVTATWVGHADALERIGRAVLLAEEADGNIRRPAGGHGYRGVRCGQVTVCRRDTDVLVEVRSDTAAALAPALLPLAEHVARCDVQMTVLDPTSDPQDAILAGRWAEPAHPGRGKPIGRRLIDDSKTGRTLYLGSERSKIRGRVYDKHRESPDRYPFGSLRFEVQARDRYAVPWARLAAGQGVDGGQLVLSLGGWFDARGVTPGLDGCWARPPVPEQPPETDWDRSRSWWASAVAPNIQRFDTPQRREAIIKALGLEAWWEPIGARDAG